MRPGFNKRTEIIEFLDRAQNNVSGAVKGVRVRCGIAD